MAESIEEEEQTNEADACFYEDTQDEFEEEVNNVDMLEEVEPFVIGTEEQPLQPSTNNEHLIATSSQDNDALK